MRTQLVFVLFACLADLPAAFSADLSLPTNGVYIAINGWRGADGPVTNGPIQFKEEIVWMPFCDSGKVELWYPLDPAYLLKITMWGPDGKEITKTRLGKSYGAEFDRWHSFKDTRLQCVYAWGSYKENTGLGGGGILAAPGDLFKMQEPGFYTMEIKMQMFRYVAKTNAEWSDHLMRFPSIRIKVERPPAK